MTEQSKRLSLRQERFVLEYLASGNATKSAEVAGYQHPNVHGSRMLVNVSVKAAIDERRAQLMTDTESKVAWLVERLTAEAVDGDNGEATRVRALEIIGKVYGAYAPEKTEISTFSGGFLADLDLDEATSTSTGPLNHNEISDLH